MQTRTITVVGAGITGLWQALTLARRGHRVRLVERSAEPFADAASAYAGAMLGPFCETEVVCAGRARSRAQVDRAVARDLSGHRRRGHAGRCERARQERGRSLRAADRGSRAHRRRRDRQAGARSRRAIRRGPVLRAGSARGAARGHAVSAGGDHGAPAWRSPSARTGRTQPRRTKRSSTAAASARGRRCPTCAACAASG